MAKKTESLVWLSDVNPVEAARLSQRDDSQQLPEGVFVVRSWNEETLTQKLAIVDRKLAKHGMPSAVPVSKAARTFVIREQQTEVNKPVEIPYIESLIYIPAAKIQIGDRKQIVGKIDRVGGSDDVVVTPWNKASDDAEAIDRLTREVGIDIRCDHCGATRRRSGAWVLRGKDGNLFMVANSCAKEYFGQNVAGMLNDLIDMEDFDPASYGPTLIERSNMIAITIATILKQGFVSASSVYELNAARQEAGLDTVITTTEFVSRMVGALNYRPSFGEQPDPEMLERQREARRLVNENTELANQVIAGIVNADAADSFQRNVQAAVRSIATAKDWFKFQTLVVAGVANFLKSEGMEIPSVWQFKAAAVKQAPVEFVGGYLGRVGEVLTETATVEAVRFISSDFGGKYILTLRTQSNHCVVYFGTANVKDNEKTISIGDLETGDILYVRGKVSDHKEWVPYKGSPVYQTIVQRPTLIRK